jgi:peptidoglycan glycosyltransferase
MNKQIRRLGLALMCCFVALFAQLNYIQVFRAKDLNSHPGNVRPIEQAFAQPRGSITTADGILLAKSVEVPDQYKFKRVYPTGDLFGQITGYLNYSFGSSGVEQEYNSELAGRTPEQQFHTLSDLFSKEDRYGNVTLTLRNDLQQVAKDQLGNRRGSAVVLDVKTGDILAMWSYPSYDPGPLSDHGKDPKIGENAISIKKLLDAAPGTPLRSRAYRQTFAPGSTFKTVTGSIGVNVGKVTPDSPVYPQLDGLPLPQTNNVVLHNYDNEVCGGTLFEILAVSCNSAFAQMGLDIGPTQMVDGAQMFGFNQTPPIDMPYPEKSVFPTDYDQRLPSLAQAAIGQYDVRATPLQMALVAATIANKGKTMAPHVLQEIRDNDGKVVRTWKDEQWLQPISEQTAETMRQAMIGVVQNGTATGIQIDGYEVGGKTGTAEATFDPPTNHAWMIAFAGPPGQDPTVAVAVLVENVDGEASESTGGQVAAPIAKALLEKALAIKQGGG